MTDSAPLSYEFGPFRLDVGRRLLLRGEEPVRLPPKALETLLALVEAEGRLMTKDELLHRVWPETYVDESNLSQNVFLLRKALGEAKDEHRYIVTMPGSGYRFAAPVRTTNAAATAAPTDAMLRSLAVLPFRAIDGEADDSRVGAGLADALTVRLSEWNGIAIRSTASLQATLTTAFDPRACGVALQVDAILTGVYQRDGEQLRVTAELLRVADGTTLWSAHFDELFTTIFALQDRIAEQVVTALAARLRGSNKHGDETTEVEAFRHYVRGRYFWNKRTTEGVQKALDFARKAIELDPAYARAWVGVADCYNLLGGQLSALAPNNAFPKAKAAALRALELDEAMGEAFASLAFVNFWYEWDAPAADRHFRRAIELKPGYATAHHWYAESLARRGRLDEAQQHFERATELDPLSNAITTDFASLMAMRGEFSRSEEALRGVLEQEPAFVPALAIRASVRARQDDYKGAIALLRDAAQVVGRAPIILAALARYHVAAGERGEARELLTALHKLGEDRYVSWSEMAMVYTQLGEHERALDLLERAVERREVPVTTIERNWRFDPLRAEARFQAIEERVRRAISV
jgi:DNA-binding winged helix-turn-helix (wHTH) protein/Tfp pilus assembly protein PilF